MEKYGVETTIKPPSEKVGSENYQIGRPVCGVCGCDLDYITNYCESCKKVPIKINTRIETGENL